MGVLALATPLESMVQAHRFPGCPLRDRVATVHSQMTVYEGAVRIVGKDGRELVPWRVAVYERGRVIRYATVPASTVAEAARRVQLLYPKGAAIAF